MNQQSILDFMHRDPKISAVELSDKLNITVRNVEKNIEKLKELKILIREGSDKSGQWTIKKGKI